MEIPLNYKVKILVPEGGEESEKTAEIVFFNQFGRKTEETQFKVIEKETIYQWIDEGKNVNLNYAYIKDFSLSDYRDSKGLHETTPISLKGFSARKAFFDIDNGVDFSYGVFEGSKTNFDTTIFGNGNVTFASSNFGEGDANFKKCRFGDGRKDFQYVEFGIGNVSFGGTRFGNGDISFINTDFGQGNVDFKNAVFGDGNVDFKFSKFGSGDVSFEKAEFRTGKKDFKTVEFGGGKIEFRRIQFNDGDVSFEACEFGSGKVSFKLSSFGKGDKHFDISDFGTGDASFEQIEWGEGKVSFNDITVDEISFKGSQLNNYFDLRFNSCRILDLSDTIIRDIIDLMPADKPVKIETIFFTGMRNLGRIYIDWRENNVEKLIYSQKDTSLAQKAEQFRMLKEDFHTNGQYVDEDKSYVEFKRCETESDFNLAVKEHKYAKIWAYPSYIFKWLVFDKMGLYATDPIRVLFSMVIVYVLNSLIFFSFDILHASSHIYTTITGVDNMGGIDSLGVAFYYSGITFLTIGYGDYLPLGVLRYVAIFEGFTGMFMMSYFTVAFVRKILR